MKGCQINNWRLRVYTRTRLKFNCVRKLCYTITVIFTISLYYYLLWMKRSVNRTFLRNTWPREPRKLTSILCIIIIIMYFKRDLYNVDNMHLPRLKIKVNVYKKTNLVRVSVSRFSRILFLGILSFLLYSVSELEKFKFEMS